MRKVTKASANKSQHNAGIGYQNKAQPEHMEMAYSAKGPLQQTLERDNMHAARTAYVNDIYTAPPIHRGG